MSSFLSAWSELRGSWILEGWLIVWGVGGAYTFRMERMVISRMKEYPGFQDRIAFRVGSEQTAVVAPCSLRGFKWASYTIGETRNTKSAILYLLSFASRRGSL